MFNHDNKARTNSRFSRNLFGGGCVFHLNIVIECVFDEFTVSSGFATCLRTVKPFSSSSSLLSTRSVGGDSVGSEECVPGKRRFSWLSSMRPWKSATKTWQTVPEAIRAKATRHKLMFHGAENLVLRPLAVTNQLIQNVPAKRDTSVTQSRFPRHMENQILGWHRR